jgi:ParB/RepB/Spo0J family partition protein
MSNKPPTNISNNQNLLSILPPELATFLSQGNLSPAEKKNLQRLIEKTFEPEISATAKQNPPTPPRSPVRLLTKTRFAAKDGKTVIRAARTRLFKRQSKIKRDANVLLHGPQGEAQSRILADKVMMLPLDRVMADPDFKNIRLTATEEELSLLMESMKHEGLKVPIMVIEAPDEDDLWYVRSGFRRTEAALRLRWRHVPAIVLPADAPEEDEYWSNIIENSARQNLHSYEIARAAQIMRDKFDVDYKDFATKAGYSNEYVDNLLRAVDRLPDAILEKWKDRATRIPVDCYVAWSSMLPLEALHAFNTFAAQHPHSVASPIPDIPSPPIERDPRVRRHRLTTATTYGLCRMVKLRLAIESTPHLDEKVRRMGVQIVDYCMGNIDDVAGIYNCRTKLQETRNRKKPADK